MSEENKNLETPKTREQYMADYLKYYVVVQNEIKPLRENLTEVRKGFIERGELTKEDIKMANRFYKFMKDDVDVDEFMKDFEELSKEISREELA